MTHMLFVFLLSFCQMLFFIVLPVELRKKKKKKTLDSVILLLHLTHLYVPCGVACYWKSCTTVTLLKIILKLVAWLILISFSPVLDHSCFFWLGRSVQETWRPAGRGESGSLIYLPPHLSLPVSPVSPGASLLHH